MAQSSRYTEAVPGTVALDFDTEVLSQLNTRDVACQTDGPPPRTHWADKPLPSVAQGHEEMIASLRDWGVAVNRTYQYPGKQPQPSNESEQAALDWYLMQPIPMDAQGKVGYVTALQRSTVNWPRHTQGNRPWLTERCILNQRFMNWYSRHYLRQVDIPREFKLRQRMNRPFQGNNGFKPILHDRVWVFPYDNTVRVGPYIYQYPHHNAHRSILCDAYTRGFVVDNVCLRRCTSDDVHRCWSIAVIEQLTRPGFKFNTLDSTGGVQGQHQDDNAQQVTNAGN